jgi:signal transduction histidine kinase
VAQLRPEDDPPPLAREFPWAEVERLATDFETYLVRLHAFIERERLFTADVSHELRTPLAVIKGATELLLTDPSLAPRSQGRVARIDRAVAEMGEISGALLALAREQEAPATAPPICEVETVARELVARYRELFRGKHLALTLTVLARPRIAADRAVLALVLGNLLRNALNFTSAGEVVVRLEADAVAVEDTGPGLGVDDPSRLFRPYIRGDGSDGAGLGLSLVQRLCARQGWTITLADRPQGGTEATLGFGAAAAPPPASAEAPPDGPRGLPQSSES